MREVFAYAGYWVAVQNPDDQRWSLTDCSSFLLMEQRGISEALAYDRDFEQAGFIPLLRYS